MQAADTFAENARIGKALADRYRNLLSSIDSKNSRTAPESSFTAPGAASGGDFGRMTTGGHMTPGPPAHQSRQSAISDTLSRTRPLSTPGPLVPSALTTTSIPAVSVPTSQGGSYGTASMSTAGGSQRFYTHEFIEQMKQKNKEALQRAHENAEEMLREKDLLVKKLKNRINDMDSESLDSEKNSAEELRSVRREISALAAEIQKVREEESLIAQRTIGDMRASHREKLSSLRVEYEQSIAEMREWARNEVSAINAEKDATITELEKEIGRAKAQYDAEAGGVQVQYERQYEELRMALASECERASTIEQEIAELETHHRQKIIELEAKVADARQEADALQRQLETQIQRFESAQDNHATVLSQRLQQQAQMYQQERIALERRIADVESLLLQADAVREDQLHATEADVQMLNELFTKSTETVKAFEDENKRLVQELMEQAEAREIMEEELSIQRNEARALKEANEGLIAEIEKLDKIMMAKGGTGLRGTFTG